MFQNKENKNPISEYFKLIKQFSLLPNFWMSKEYIDKSGWVWVEEGSLKGFKLPDESNEWSFPPIIDGNGFVYCNNIYSGFLSELNTDENLLDLQFIYYPQDFLSLKGKKWRVFRKNIRKYSVRNPGNIVYQKIKVGEHYVKIKKLFLQWTKNRTFYDNEVMIKYVFEGKNRFGLFNNEQLVGMNVYDENPFFINYRFCIDDGTLFLNEYLRFRFYTHPAILLINKYVNDGGCLDSEGLKQFKMKLNPIKVYKVFSYIEGK